MTPDLRIEEATFHVLVAFDIGFEVRMSQIEALFKQHARDPVGYNFLAKSLGRDNQPLRFGYGSARVPLAGRVREFEVYVTFFDLGAISLEFICPLESIQEMPSFSIDAFASREIPAVARKLAEKIFEQARPAIVGPELFPLPSTYAVVNIKQLSEPFNTEMVVNRMGSVIAKTLRASEEPIGSAEITRTLNPNITYSDEDVVFCSSNVAVVLDETSAEVIDIFELLNTQSLELRWVDGRLDRTIQTLYEETPSTSRSSVWRYFANIFEVQSRRLNTIHLDSTLIAERVDQGFKFSSDSYLVRIHELGVQKMFLNAISRGIDRKLDVIRNIITDQRDRANSIRMEILEWIIILLIAVDVVPKLGRAALGLFR